MAKFPASDPCGHVTTASCETPGPLALAAGGVNKVRLASADVYTPVLGGWA